MIKKITPTISIETAPLNWIVKRNNKNSYFGDFNQVRRHLLAQYTTRKGKEEVFVKLKELIKELGLESTEDLCAWHLTKIKKHPAFRPNVSANSIKNLKFMKNPSGKHRRNGSTTKNTSSLLKINKIA